MKGDGVCTPLSVVSAQGGSSVCSRGEAVHASLLRPSLLHPRRKPPQGLGTVAVGTSPLRIQSSLSSQTRSTSSTHHPQEYSVRHPPSTPFPLAWPSPTVPSPGNWEGPVSIRERRPAALGCTGLPPTTAHRALPAGGAQVTPRRCLLELDSEALARLGVMGRHSYLLVQSSQLGSRSLLTFECLRR